LDASWQSSDSKRNKFKVGGQERPLTQLAAGFGVYSSHRTFLEEINVRKMWARLVPALLIVVGSVLLAGCPPRVSIAKLSRDPGRYAGRGVTIAGRVVDSYGALGRGVFQVDDGTGTMWVLAGQYGVPAAGVKLAVTGHIEEGFSLGGRNFATILRETERRH
jgi:hypothetical protein